MNVLCVIVLMLGNGSRDVVSANGVVVKDGTKGTQERLLVDFGPNFPSPTTRWVDENSCVYLSTTTLQLVEQQKLQELSEAESVVDKAKWGAIIRKMEENAKKPK